MKRDRQIENKKMGQCKVGWIQKNRKTGKISWILFLLSLVLIGLCSCNLASGEGEEQSRDRLIGGMVTREPIDEKIYATVENRGKDGYLWGMEFEGVLGDSFFYHEEKTDDGMVRAIGYDASVSYLEEEESKVMEVSHLIYVAPEPGETINHLYLHPLYKTEDGKLYIMPGECVSLGSGMNTEGVTTSITLEETEKITFGQNQQVDKVIVRASFEVVYDTMKIRFVQFDKDNTLLSREEYEPGEVPFDYVTDPKAEFVLMEIEQLKPDGTRVWERQTYEWEGLVDEYTNERNEVYHTEKVTNAYYYRGKEDGFIEKKLCRIIWAEE